MCMHIYIQARPAATPTIYFKTRPLQTRLKDANTWYLH